MSETITQFVGEYRWLSNFFYSPMQLWSLIIPTVEHGYQATKTLDPGVAIKILSAPSPAEAKRLGRTVELRHNWNEVKLEVMAVFLRLKFDNPHLRNKLLSTADMQLIEGNYFNDTFWGVDLKRGQGENHLGRLLMEIRDNLRHSS